MLYIIGGTSRSGKSLLAHKILKEKLVPFFPLDGLVGTLAHSAPEHGVRHQNDFVSKSEKTWKFSKELFIYFFKLKHHIWSKVTVFCHNKLPNYRRNIPDRSNAVFSAIHR